MILLSDSGVTGDRALRLCSSHSGKGDGSLSGFIAKCMCFDESRQRRPHGITAGHHRHCSCHYRHTQFPSSSTTHHDLAGFDFTSWCCVRFLGVASLFLRGAILVKIREEPRFSFRSRDRS